jgi:oligoribonuclease NrnB/cAMP/cGMP phosphodiesterase (DHH superfamily)
VGDGMDHDRYERVRESLLEVVRDLREQHPKGRKISMIDALDAAERAFEVAILRHDPTMHTAFEDYARRMSSAAIYERLGDHERAEGERDAAYRRRRG